MTERDDPVARRKRGGRLTIILLVVVAIGVWFR